MNFPTCGSTATYLLLLLFTQYKTIHDLPLSAVPLSHCITCQDVCVPRCQSRPGLPFSDFKQTQIVHQKQPYSYHNAILDNQKANLDHCDGKCAELRMHLFIVENELHSAFPNTEVAFRIYLCLVVSNYTEDRSFSKLRRIQNYCIFEGQLCKKN